MGRVLARTCEARLPFCKEVNPEVERARLGTGVGDGTVERACYSEASRPWGLGPSLRVG